MKIRRTLLVSLLLVAPVACATRASREYDDGATPAFARSSIAEATAEPAAAAPRTSEETKKILGHIDELATQWGKRSLQAPAGPVAFGLPEAKAPSAKELAASVTPERIYAAAYAMSPAIAASQKDFRATVEEFHQVAYLNAVLLQYVAFTKDLNLRIGAPLQERRIDTEFPFPGSAALESRIVASEAEQARQSLAATVRKTLTAAGKAYYDYAYLDRAIRIVEDTIGALDGVKQIAQSKYGVGKASQALVLRIMVEEASLRDRLVTLQRKRGTAAAKINAVLGRPADTPLGPPRTPLPAKAPKTAATFLARVDATRQEVRALEAKIRGTEDTIALAQTRVYPPIATGQSLFERNTATRSGGATKASPFPSVPRTMPKFWFGQNASFIAQMRERLAAAKKHLAELKAQVQYQVKDAWFAWDAAWRKVLLERDSLLPQSKQAYDVLQSGFSNGIADLIDVLDAERVWLSHRLDYQQAIRDSNQARLSLVDAFGGKVEETSRKGK